MRHSQSKLRETSEEEIKSKVQQESWQHHRSRKTSQSHLFPPRDEQLTKQPCSGRRVKNGCQKFDRTEHQAKHRDEHIKVE